MHSRERAAGSDLAPQCVCAYTNTQWYVPTMAWWSEGTSLFRSGLDPSSHVQSVMPCLAHDPRACRSEIKSGSGWFWF